MQTGELRMQRMVSIDSLNNNYGLFKKKVCN